MLFLFYVLVLWPGGLESLGSMTWDQTCTPCIRRQSLNHWTAREVLYYFFKGPSETLSYCWLPAHPPTAWGMHSPLGKNKQASRSSTCRMGSHTRKGTLTRKPAFSKNQSGRHFPNFPSTRPAPCLPPQRPLVRPPHLPKLSPVQASPKSFQLPKIPNEK